MIWEISHRFDREALALANTHYNRQTPDSPQFVAPGRCVVLLSTCRRALWVSLAQEHIDHEWPDTWNNALFRNEGAGLSSQLIRSAISATLYQWHDRPAGGFLTFVDADSVRSSNPGYCYKRAGFEFKGKTKVRGRLAFVLPVEKFPAPAPAIGATYNIFGGVK